MSTPQSSRLRERLKRNRHSFISPLLSNKKKPKLDKEEDNNPVSDEGIRGKPEFSQADSHHVTQDLGASSSLSKMSNKKENEDERECHQDETSSCVELLLAEKKSLEAQLTRKRETLRKLRMVKTYHGKNDLQNLSQLTTQWREVAQEAAEVLLGYNTHQPCPSMAQLLEHFHIDPELIHYSIQDETFY